MTKTILTLLTALTMLSTMGNKTIEANPEMAGYKQIAFSKEDAFSKYVTAAPYSVQIYFYTKKYCAEFNVPEEIAFSVARLETNYRGPDMFHYKPNQTSYANARGTYQIMLPTAKFVVEKYPELFPGITKDDITPAVLLHDVHLNTKIGIKYLQHLHNIYNSWIIACGFYNTGYPKINQYARDAVKYLI